MITHYLSPITIQLVDTESTSMHMATHTTLSFSWPYGIPLPCPTYTTAIPSSVPLTLRPSPPLSHLHYGHPLLCPTYTMAIPSSVPLTLRPSPPLSHLHYGHPLLCPTHAMVNSGHLFSWPTYKMVDPFPNPSTHPHTPLGRTQRGGGDQLGSPLQDSAGESTEPAHTTWYSPHQYSTIYVPTILLSIV